MPGTAFDDCMPTNASKEIKLFFLFLQVRSKAVDPLMGGKTTTLSGKPGASMG